MTFCHMGKKNFSMKIKAMQQETIMKTNIEPAGILKWGPRWRFMVMAWRVAKLIWTASGVLNKMPVDQSGEILIRVFRSSTCCNVHSFHNFAIEPSGLVSPSVSSAARFRNLCVEKCNFWFDNERELKWLKKNFREPSQLC